MKSRVIRKQFIVFLFVGVMNTAFGYSFFAFFIFLNIPYYLALFFAALLGLIFKFITTGRIVFENKHFNVFYKFLINNIFLYLINIALIKLIHRIINNFYISGLITVLFTAILSFYLNKRIFSIKINDGENLEKVN